jgi:hypothetical protein
MEFGKIHCGGCQKDIGYFPSDNKPKDKGLELYCHSCMESLEESDSKEELNVED